MSKPVVEVQVRAVAAVGGGCAVFLGNEDKVFVMFVDQSVGAAITMFRQGTQKGATPHFHRTDILLRLPQERLFSSSPTSNTLFTPAAPANALVLGARVGINSDNHRNLSRQVQTFNKMKAKSLAVTASQAERVPDLWRQFSCTRQYFSNEPHLI